MEQTTTYLLFFHSIIRWIILLSFSIAFLRLLISFLTKYKITATVVIGNKVSMILMDVQLIIGLLLYFFFSQTTKAGFSDWKIAMKNKELRFFLVEHITIMLLATISFHIANIVLKRNYTQKRKLSLMMGIYFFILILFIIGIPWFRPIFRGI